MQSEGDAAGALHGAAQQKIAVESGVWLLYRFDPRGIAKGEAPLDLDYGPPKAKVADV